MELSNVKDAILAYCTRCKQRTQQLAASRRALPPEVPSPELTSTDASAPSSASAPETEAQDEPEPHVPVLAENVSEATPTACTAQLQHAEPAASIATPTVVQKPKQAAQPRLDEHRCAPQQLCWFDAASTTTFVN